MSATTTTVRPEALVAARKKAGLTQTAAAAAAGIDRTQLWRIEKGQATPHPDTLARLAKAYGVAVPSGPRCLRIPEAADRLGCSRGTVYNLIAEGRLASVAVGSLTRVREDDLERFIDANTTPARKN